MPTQEEFFRDLEELQELDNGSLTGGERLESIRWDSMAVVMFIASADEKYGRAVAPGKLNDAETVDDLFRILESSS